MVVAVSCSLLIVTLFSDWMLWGLISTVKDSNYSDPLSICGVSSDVRTPSSHSLVSPHSPFYFVLSCLLSLCWHSHRMLFCVHVCIQRRSLLLRLGVHVGCTNGLSSARQKGSCLLGGWTPLSCTEGLVPTLWIAFSLRCGGLLS